MATSPVSPSPFDKVIRAVGTLQSRGGVAAFTVLLLFLCFIFSLFLAQGILQWVLSIMSLLFLVGFAVFAVFRLEKDDKKETTQRTGV